METLQMGLISQKTEERGLSSQYPIRKLGAEKRRCRDSGETERGHLGGKKGCKLKNGSGCRVVEKRGGVTRGRK